MLSIIIATRNQAESLKECLHCLSQQTYRDFEIIVIDNNSSPDQSSLIRDLCREFGALYDFELILGCHAARNRGLSIASGDLIGFTDSDCKPWPTWISGAVLGFDVHHYQAIAGHVNFTFSTTPPPIAEYLDSITHLQQRLYADQNYGAGANLWIRRECFEKVGFFREDLINLGDREWGERAKSLGVTVSYSPLTTVDHPARSWPQLLKKIWKQAYWKHRIKPFTWADIFTAARVPWQNYQATFKDPQLPGFRKIMFLLALHFVGFFQALRIITILFSEHPPDRL